MNLLDLDNDCLNIIGNIVKRENKRTEIINIVYEMIIEVKQILEREINLEDLYEDICDYLIEQKTNGCNVILRRGFDDEDGSIKILNDVLNDVFDYADEVKEKLRCNGSYINNNDDRIQLLNEIYIMYIYTIYEIDIEPSKKANINKKLLDYLINFKNDIDDGEDFNILIDLIDIIENTKFNLTDDGYSGSLYDDIKAFLGTNITEFIIKKS